MKESFKEYKRDKKSPKPKNVDYPEVFQTKDSEKEEAKNVRKPDPNPEKVKRLDMIQAKPTIKSDLKKKESRRDMRIRHKGEKQIAKAENRLRKAKAKDAKRKDRAAKDKPGTVVSRTVKKIGKAIKNIKLPKGTKKGQDHPKYRGNYDEVD